MPYSGSCPSCAERLRFAELPLPKGRCTRCGAEFLAMAPDGEDPAGDVAIELVPYERAEADHDPWAPARTARQLVPVASAGLLALCAGFVLLLLLAFALSVASPSSQADLTVALTASGLLIVAGIAFVGRRVRAQAGSTRGFQRFRSVFAVLAGLGALLAANLLLDALWRVLVRAVESDALRLPFSFVVLIVPAGVAGWVCAGYAPRAPVRHALALGLAYSLAATLMTLPIVGAQAFAYGLAQLLYLPVLLVGAWSRRRFESRSVAA